MEAFGKLSSDADGEGAEKFYAEALLLVDCCKIPEAITLLEKAIELDPSCEIYRETLEFFHASPQACPDYLQNGPQELNYANITRSKPHLNYEKENTRPHNWKTKNSTVKENRGKSACSPTASATCFSNLHAQSTINHPWASYMSRNSNRKKRPSSSIDSLSEIEIPKVNGMCYTQSTTCKMDQFNQEPFTTPGACRDSQQAIPKVERPAVFTRDDYSSASVNHSQSCIGSEKTGTGRPVVFSQDNHVDASDDHEHLKKNDALKGHHRNCENRDESLDARFVEELCNARELVTDEWAKYYDVLYSGLNQDAGSDKSHPTAPSNCGSTDTLDEVSDIEGSKHGNHSPRNRQGSEATPTYSKGVCSKCGLVQTSGNSPTSSSKTRIHFVKGACVSSATSPNCTCHQQSRNCSKEQSVRSPLSPSQQDFYRNLRSYFGNGKVKSQKTTPGADNGDILTMNSDPVHWSSNLFSTNDSSGTATKESRHKNENVAQSTQYDAESKTKKSKKRFREVHIDKEEVKLKSDDVSKESSRTKPLFKGSETESDQKASSHERSRPMSKRTKTRAHDKDGSKTKLPSKNVHVNDVKEGVLQSDSSEINKPGVKDKTRVDSKMKAEDVFRAEQTLEANEKLNQQSETQRQTSLSEIDFSEAFAGLYTSGLAVIARCWEALKSILYYIVLLALLILTFLIYSIWSAACWLIQNVVHYTALDRLFAAMKSGASTLFELIKKRREMRRKPSSQGQTYDLPQNGDAAIRHMLQNKASDPYSVLGVPSDASDDDIRKQYRKLAVLIHPDKNSHDRADEAFKILANAFDILSDPEKRLDYDRETAWKKREEERRENFGRAESPEQFFADLGKKMKEMKNYLHCNQCDGKHRRYSTDRFILTARFCSRCNTRHAAREGDLWPESSFLGLKLRFYACMEGEIYDVTDWAACQGLGDYRLEANPHTVHMKLKTRQTHHGGVNSRSEDEDLDNFLRAFFGQFNPSNDGRHNGSQKQQKPRKRKKRR